MQKSSQYVTECHSQNLETLIKFKTKENNERVWWKVNILLITKMINDSATTFSEVIVGIFFILFNVAAFN